MYRNKPTNKIKQVIIDLADANNVLHRPITADSTIMHPKQKILALKGKLRTSIIYIRAWLILLHSWTNTSDFQHRHKIKSQIYQWEEGDEMLIRISVPWTDIPEHTLILYIIQLQWF